MRVCPKCGYTQDAYWRNSRYCTGLDYCYYEDFKKMKPALAEKLKVEREVKDGTFIYRLGMGGTGVERLDIEFHSWHGWRPKYEFGDHKYHGESLKDYI